MAKKPFEKPPENNKPVTLADFLEDFPGFKETGRQPLENGGNRVTCGNKDGVQFELTLPRNGLLNPQYARTTRILVRGKIERTKQQASAPPPTPQQHFSMRYDHSEGGMTFDYVGKVLTIRPSDARWLTDVSEIDDGDPAYQEKLRQRIEIIKHARLTVDKLADIYHKKFGLETTITRGAITFSHPLLKEKERHDAASPLRTGETANHFKKLLTEIYNLDAHNKARIASLTDHGFTVKTHRGKHEATLIISREADDFEPIELALSPHSGFLLEDSKELVSRLTSQYPPAEKLPAVTHLPVNQPPQREIPDAPPPRHRIHAKPHTAQGYVVRNGTKIFVQPEAFVTASQEPIISDEDTTFFHALCNKLAALPRVTLMFDTNVLNLLDIYRGCAASKRTNLRYYGLMPLTEHNPVVRFVGSPGFTIDLEFRDLISNPNDSNPKTRMRSIIDSSTLSSPIARVSNSIQRAFFSDAHRWAINAEGDPYFIKGYPHTKQMVWESLEQHQLYAKLLQQAEVRSGATDGPAFFEALMEARKTVGLDKGEDFCLKTARDYDGYELILNIADDKRLAHNVRGGNHSRMLHTKSGRGIGWVRSLDWLNALDVSYDGRLAQALDSLDGLANGNYTVASFDEILRDFDHRISRKNREQSNDGYTQMMSHMPPPSYGFRSNGEAEPSLEECLIAGMEVKKLMAELEQRQQVMAFMRAAGKHKDAARIKHWTQEIISGIPDPLSSRLSPSK